MIADIQKVKTNGLRQTLLKQTSMAYNPPIALDLSICFKLNCLE